MRQQIAEHVHMFTGTDVNWIIVADGADLTLIDAGWHGDTRAVERSIRSLGRRPEDVQAVLLTHAHADHTGAVNHLHDTYGTVCHLDAAEMPNALGTVTESAGPLDVAERLYRPRVLRWTVRIARAGALRHSTVTAPSPFPSEGQLDLPGRPVPIPTPGHTSGRTSYLLPAVGVLVSGDALITAHPTVAATRPQLLPSFFAHDSERAAQALEVLRPLAAATLAPGHGPSWSGPIGEAVDLALNRVRERS